MCSHSCKSPYPLKRTPRGCSQKRCDLCPSGFQCPPGGGGAPMPGSTGASCALHRLVKELPRQRFGNCRTPNGCKKNEENHQKMWKTKKILSSRVEVDEQTNVPRLYGDKGREGIEIAAPVLRRFLPLDTFFPINKLNLTGLVA